LLYLILTVLFNVLVSTALKLYPRYHINSLQAIVFNYIVCVITGILFTGIQPFTTTTLHAPWFPWTILMGIAFISIFNLTAHCTKVDGMTTTIIASKLSLVIPVIAAIILYHDALGLGKIAGIALALPAMYLTTRTHHQPHTTTPSLFWPAMLFLFSGGLDTLVNYIQHSFLSTPSAQASATIVCFATAGAAGILVVGYLVITGRQQLHWHNLVAGICLGIPNFFSIYFLVRALNSSLFQSSATIPLVNISILVATSIAAIVFFREAAGRLRIIGLLLSIIAILLIGFGDR
jgi:drug/metabolite transporter (DMT)-like permease